MILPRSTKIIKLFLFSVILKRPSKNLETIFGSHNSWPYLIMFNSWFRIKICSFMKWDLGYLFSNSFPMSLSFMTFSIANWSWKQKKLIIQKYLGHNQYCVANSNWMSKHSWWSNFDYFLLLFPFFFVQLIVYLKKKEVDIYTCQKAFIHVDTNRLKYK